MVSISTRNRTSIAITIAVKKGITRSDLADRRDSRPSNLILTGDTFSK